MNCYKCATPLPDNSKFCMACGADVSGDHTHHVTGTMQPDPELLNMLQAELGDDYKVEKELGRGGMAIVFLATDKHLGRKVAVKLLPPMLTFGSGPGFIDRFKREARTAATLDHPNIIPVYRVSSGGKLFWYIMKFLQGESLDTTLKRDGQFDVDRVVSIISQTAEALDYAHSNKVVHRDVKPANIMLDGRGRVTVTDFGIAKALEATAYTNSGATIGTPHYMAPEQCAGLPLTGAADQYALAVSAYQMLSGHLPFAADSVLELMRMHAQDPPPPLATLRPSLPQEMVDVVERGLAKEADERFPSCADFARALASAASKMSADARKPSLTAGNETAMKIRVNTPRGKATPPPRPLTRTVLETPATRKRAYAAIGGGLFLVIAAVVLYPMLMTKGANTSGTTGSQSRPTPPNASPDTAGQLAANAAGADTQRADSIAAATQAAAPPVRTDSSRATDSTPTDTKTRPLRAPAAGNTKQGSSRTATKQNAGGTEAKQSSAAKSTATDSATITVGTLLTNVSILVNGKPTNANPLRSYKVPAGVVRLTFQVTDSTGIWSVDTVVTLAANEDRRMGRLTLKHP